MSHKTRINHLHRWKHQLKAWWWLNSLILRYVIQDFSSISVKLFSIYMGKSHSKHFIILVNSHFTPLVSDTHLFPKLKPDKENKKKEGNKVCVLSDERRGQSSDTGIYNLFRIFKINWHVLLSWSSSMTTKKTYFSHFLTNMSMLPRGSVGVRSITTRRS